MEVPYEQRYYLSMFKSMRNELFVPESGKFATFHLDKDYKLMDLYYDFTLDRTQKDSISFVLTKRWDMEAGEMNENVFVMTSDVNREYRFAFCGNDVSLDELQLDFVIADYFVPEYLFGEDSEKQIYAQARFFLALCGCVPEIYDYVEDSR